MIFIPSNFGPQGGVGGGSGGSSGGMLPNISINPNN
jgi:hypothetical protein